MMKVTVLLFVYHSMIKIFNAHWTDGHPNYLLNITELIKKYGYPVETHEILSEDGYFINIFRISHGKESSRINQKPVLLMHGVFGQGENFLSTAMLNCSTAFFLADHGYDVWLGNNRGSEHGFKHVKLNFKKMKYWNYSYHEIAIYDLRAMVDHILKVTNQKKIFYVSHSQGGTLFYILNSMIPEYQEKFRAAVLLAPPGLMKNFRHPIFLPLAKDYKRLTKMAEAGKLVQFLPLWFNFKVIINVCSIKSFRNFCDSILNYVFGCGSKEVDLLVFGYMLQHVASVSIWQVLHYAQAVESGHFRQWDYGKKKNMKIYGVPEPPDYPLETIDIPITVMYGLSDNMVNFTDIEATCDRLPKCSRHLMANPKWEHAHFIMSINSNKVINEPIVEIFDEFP